MIVAGRDERGDPAAVAAFAAAAGVPLLADPLSGARRGPAAVAHYDALLRDAAFAAAHAPDLVVRVGDLPTSKPLRQWLAALDGARQIALDPEGAWQDPAAVVADSFAFGVGSALAAAAVARPWRPPATAWLDGWRAADAAAAAAIAETVPADGAERAGGRRRAGRVCPPGRRSSPRPRCRSATSRRSGPPATTRRACSPTAARTASTARSRRRSGPRQRATGRSCCTSATSRSSTTSARSCPPRGSASALAIVLVDNGGGGIFDFLPVATQTDAFEEHVATPTGLDFARVAALFGLGYAAPATMAEVRAALETAVAAAGHDADPRPHRPGGERRPAPARVAGGGRRRPGRAVASRAWSRRASFPPRPPPTAATPAAHVEGDREGRHRRGRPQGAAVPRGRHGDRAARERPLRARSAPARLAHQLPPRDGPRGRDGVSPRSVALLAPCPPT